MSKRKCTYTGQDSDDKDSVIPRHLTKDTHNWASFVPTTTDYKQQKSDRYPTELEIQATETFYLLEVSKLKVEFYENQLSKIQSEINKSFKSKPVEKPKNEGKRAAKKKDKEVEIAEKQRDIQEVEYRMHTFLREKITELDSVTTTTGNGVLPMVDSKGLWDE